MFAAAQPPIVPLVTPVPPLVSPPIFGSSSLWLHFSNVLLPPTSRASGSTSSSLSHTPTSSLFVSLSFSVSLTSNPKARKTTPDKPATRIETSQELQKAASRDLESLAYAFAVIEKSIASPERIKELKAAIREGVASAVCRLPTALEYKKTPFGVISRPVLMLKTEPLDTIASIPQSSTPPLPSTGEPDAAAEPHSTVETASVIEPQSVSEI